MALFTSIVKHTPPAGTSSAPPPTGFSSPPPPAVTSSTPPPSGTSSPSPPAGTPSSPPSSQCPSAPPSHPPIDPPCDPAPPTVDEDRYAVVQHNTIREPVPAQEEYEQVHPIPAEDYSRIQRDVGLAKNKPFVSEEGYGKINHAVSLAGTRYNALPHHTAPVSEGRMPPRVE